MEKSRYLPGGLCWRLGGTAPEVASDAVFRNGTSTFSPIRAEVVDYVVPKSLGERGTPGLPKLLTYDSTQWPGVEKLNLHFTAGAGRYLFRFRYLHPVSRRIRKGDNVEWDGRKLYRLGPGDTRPSRLGEKLLRKWVREVDDRVESSRAALSELSFLETDEYANQPRRNLFEICLDATSFGYFAEHHPRYHRSGKDRFEVVEIELPLLIVRGGWHAISLNMVRGPDPQVSRPVMAGLAARYASIRLVPLQYELRRLEGFRRHNPFALEVPGQPEIGTWGWLSSIWYQRLNREALAGTSPDYMMKKVIDESYKWGANNLELYVTTYHQEGRGRGATFQWDRDDPIPGSENYLHHPCKRWPDSAYKALIRHAHRRGLLIHWLWHPPYKGSHWRFPKGWYENVMRKVMTTFSCALERPWQDCLDGLGQESSQFTAADIIHWTNLQYEINPGCYSMEALSENRRSLPGISPSLSEYWTAVSRGRDDRNGGWALSRGTDIDEGGFGRGFIHYQANCRSLSNGPYGDAYPDWFLKQVNDFVRVLRLGMPWSRGSSLVWINESQGCTAEWSRRYVYAIGQDPIRCAIAGRFTSTGKGGIFDGRRGFRDHAPGTPYRRVHEEEAGDSFIQNNWLQVVVGTARDRVKLRHDPEGVGHYDSGSLSVVVSEALIATITRTVAVTGVTTEETCPEPGGYVAVLESTLSFDTNNPAGGGFRERRRFTMINDQPLLSLRIEREHLRQQQHLGTAMDLAGYDVLEHGGRTYTSPHIVSVADNGGTSKAVFRVSSRNSLQPSLAIVLTVPGAITEAEWVPGKRLVFWSMNPGARAHPRIFRQVDYRTTRKREDIEITFAVASPLYRLDDNTTLAAIAGDVIAPVRFGDKPQTSVRNRHPYPKVKAVSVADPDDGPYLVEENGWWICRGAQPSLENKGMDYLRLYLPAGGTVRIHRHGFIKGVVQPGWGCQNILAIAEVRGGPKGKRLKCRVNVLDASLPMIFAPRVRFSSCIARAWLDGRPWHYFEDDILFLPRQGKSFDVEIEKGRSDGPHVLRTVASIAETAAEERLFGFRAEAPGSITKLPPALQFTAIVDLHRAKLLKVTGGSVVRQCGTRVIVRFRPGHIRLTLTI